MAAKPPDPACTRGSRTTATRVVLGDISLSRSSNFALKLNSKLVKPVALPPGRAKLATKPLPTGSIVVTNTIGTVRLICSKSATIELAVPRTTSGFDATSSAAYLRNSSVLPAPQRVSTCTLPPSCQPNCCSACTNAASQAWPCSASVFISTPMRRIRSGCCARAGSGNAAADPAIPWMKSRRRIAAPRLRAVRTCFGMSQLQQGITTGGMGSECHFAQQQSSGLNVRFGSKAGIMQFSKERHYPITSLAMSSIVDMSRPQQSRMWAPRRGRQQLDLLCHDKRPELRGKAFHEVLIGEDPCPVLPPVGIVIKLPEMDDLVDRSSVGLEVTQELLVVAALRKRREAELLVKFRRFRHLAHVECVRSQFVQRHQGFSFIDPIPPHSISSSAVASSDGGIVKPSALAVVRLMTRSNLVGCMTGRSAGLAPLRTRPT